jgi:hypothetical protein
MKSIASTGIGLVSASLIALSASTEVAAGPPTAALTWVSGTGNDAGDCSRTTPCKTFDGAIAKTDPNGEINCLDSGNFGSLTISKSVVIDCKGAVGNVPSTGIVVNVPNGKVVLRNLDINGLGVGTVGIRVVQAAAIHVEDVTIRGHGRSGIEFVPSAAPSSGTSQLTLVRVVSSDNGQHGILVAPVVGKASVAVSGSTFSANGLTGIRVNDNGFAALTNTRLSSNRTHGASAVSTGAGATIFLESVTTSSNQGGGVLASGSLATIYLSNVSSASNLGGSVYPSIGGGTYVSFGTNRKAIFSYNSGTVTSAPQF